MPPGLVQNQPMTDPVGHPFNPTPAAWSAIAQHGDPAVAYEQALADLGSIDPSLLFLFVAGIPVEDIRVMLADLGERFPRAIVTGSIGTGVAGTGQEVERELAVSILALNLPDTRFHPHYLAPDQADGRFFDPERLARIGIPAGRINAWLQFGDGTSFSAESFFRTQPGAAPWPTVVGGLAHNLANDRKPWFWLDGQLWDAGTLLIGLEGAWTVAPFVAQGAEPIGEPWTISQVNEDWIERISGRPATDVLLETLGALPEGARELVQRNVLVGLAVDEYRERFARGDFLVRAITGIDRTSGAFTVQQAVQVGQTIQFQVRHAGAASFDLSMTLRKAASVLAGSRPLAALQVASSERGRGLFKFPHHDSRAVAACFPNLPAAGFFANGEIAPVGGRVHLHGTSLVLGFFVPVAPDGGDA